MRYRHCVLLFKSIHDVTAAEKLLKARNLWCDMVPTPRALHSNCGMVLEFHGRDLEQIKGALRSAPVALVGIFTSDGTEYEKEPLETDG